jgi:hypothetical protein
MWTADVEAVLPVSPTACLHILPAVQRTLRVVPPTPSEVNRAQGAFATQYCYAHKNDPQIDKDVRWQFGRAQIGVTAFSVGHRNYSDKMFEILMSSGASFRSPER